MERNTELARAVAIVGRPNVGKSRLFNRLVGRRISIVHDMPGVTRDLITAEVSDGAYTLMDTGGIGLFRAELTPKVVAEAVEEQVDFALAAARLVLLVVDASEGCAPLDLELALRLREAGKRVVVVANKADTEERDSRMAEFFVLGYGEPLLVSAEHGRGMPALRARVLEELGPPPAAQPEVGRPVRLALAGRPNVGKSSLGNRLLGEGRLIVSEVAGTTRDPVRARLRRAKADGSETRFVLVDTAGRRAATRQDTLDFFSQSRAEEILAETDVVFLVLDARDGVTRIDKQLAGELALLGCGIVVVVNKWDVAKEAFRDKQVDGYEDEEEFRARFRAAVRRELFFLPDPPLLFVSARTGLRTEDLLDAAEGVYLRAGTAISTGKINRLVQDLMVKRPPRMVSGRRFKCYYVTQVSARPVRFRLFCNSEERLEDSYQRYLVKGVHESFDLAGVPVFLDVVGKPKQQGRKYFAPQGTRPDDVPAAPRPAAKASAKRAGKGPRQGKSRPPRAAGRKKSYSRWNKPRSLKGRAARQARK
ncbi:MAG: ribosome biogenesis GTPase Der [Opitutales bacterium]